MNITIKMPTKNVPRIGTGMNAVSSSPYQERYGCWGTVIEIDSRDMTVSVQLDTGVIMPNLRVASMEWANQEEGYHTGERNLPRRGSFVFVMMPSGKPESGFVLCSGMTVLDTPQRDAFMATDSDYEEKNNIRETVMPGNWKKKHNYTDGIIEISSPDDRTNVRIDPNENGTSSLNVYSDIKIECIDTKSVKVDVFTDTVIECVSGSETTIKAFGATVTLKGGKIILDGEIEIKGAKFTVAGSVSPTGSGALCALPVCTFTGAPHVGSASAMN